MKLTREMIETLAVSIAATRPEEIDCDEWLQRVGRLIDTVARSEKVPPELGPVLQHIEVCPECREEFYLLLETLDDSD